VEDATPWWGGYRAEFKLIDKKLAAKLRGDIAKMLTGLVPN